jgi:small subunit ribosomal protein S6
LNQLTTQDLREYEFALITRGDLSDADHAGVLEKYEKLLLGDNGQVIDKDEWGSKKLQFTMSGQYRGRFTFYTMTSTPAHIAETERLMKIDDSVLRYMNIKLSDTVDVEARKKDLERIRHKEDKDDRR